MYSITRVKGPDKILDKPTLISNYKTLRGKNGKIIPRWNTMREKGEQIVRNELHEMSNGCCAYCGKKISCSDMDIDHFLPSSKFPYLSYCWYNFLPSCKLCNQSYKKDLSPKNLQHIKIIERCLKNEELEDKGVKIVNPMLFTKKTVLNKMFAEDRIIDPSFDIIEKHLEFNPMMYNYKGKTNIGKKTADTFFSKVEVQESIEGVSNIVLRIVYEGNSYNLVRDLKITYGYEFYYDFYWSYWNEQKTNNTKYYQYLCKKKFESVVD